MREFKFFRGIIGPRKIRAIWTPEMVQDIQAHHGIDVESELASLLSEEIARTIDSDIVTNLSNLFSTTLNNDNDLNYLNHYINMGGGNRA
jgi:hypothetical protein